MKIYIFFAFLYNFFKFLQKLLSFQLNLQSIIKSYFFIAFSILILIFFIRHKIFFAHFVQKQSWCRIFLCTIFFLNISFYMIYISFNFLKLKLIEKLFESFHSSFFKCWSLILRKWRFLKSNGIGGSWGWS